MSERNDTEMTSAAPSGDGNTPATGGDRAKSEPPIIDAQPVAPKNERAQPRKPAIAQLAPPLPSEQAFTLFTAAAKDQSAPQPRTRVRRGRFALLAASVAIAAGAGALAGALGASNFMQTNAQTETVTTANLTEETRSVQNEMAQMRTELSAIRTSVDNISRTASAQFAKFGERIDRAERAQAEPTAKLTKALEALERLERRADPAKETTGTVPAAQPAAVTPAPARPQQSIPPAQPNVIQGWTLHEVHRGIAVIQGGRYGTIEVETGDVVPGLGRIEAIRRVDGRWIVVTTKGLIASR